MKINLDEEYFKSQVKRLRRKLDECQENGILDDNFEEDLEKLIQLEEKLLTKLIPYYRVYINGIKKTSIKINTIKQLGAYDFDSFSKSILRINENLFIISGADSKVRFFYIDTIDSPSSYCEVEWSPHIKEINEIISFIYRLNDKEILLLGVMGGCYILSSDNFDKMPDINEEIKVKIIQKYNEGNNFSGFGRCLEIRYGLFVVEGDDDTLILSEITKESDSYHVVFHKDIYLSIPGWTVFEKIHDDCFVVGTKIGELYFIKYHNNKFIIDEKDDFLDGEITQIKCLDDENGNRNSLMVTGDNGLINIYSLNEGSKIIKEGLDSLEGNLFDIQSKKGTTIVLSEDGRVYLFEENFGNWYLNEEATLKEVYFTNVFKLDISRYLLMDIEGKLNLLEIERIDTPKDLWDLPLYH